MKDKTTFHIEFRPMAVRGRFPSNRTLLDCARELEIDLISLCGGNGTCGKCRLYVREEDGLACSSEEGGGTPPRNEISEAVLACQTLLDRDLVVFVPEVSLSALQRFQVEGLGTQGQLNRVAIDNGISGDRTLGMAVDLGTTKIAAYLLDLTAGATLAAEGVQNPQVSYGEDIVERINRVRMEPDTALELQRVVCETLSVLAKKLSAQVSGAHRESIVELVVVANTPMHHLLLRLPPDRLARAPYRPSMSHAVDVDARSLGIHLAKDARLHLLPNISGFVGSDHLAVLLALKAFEAKGPLLAIDIGTNTEISLCLDGEISTVSCASGPAFEGAHISCGMRAAPGAIDSFRLIGQEIQYHTIGDVLPVGICGSGILDTVAALYNGGVIQKSGRIDANHPRVRNERGKDTSFLIVEEKERDSKPAISLTQRDVREIQLAKAAIQTGIEILLRRCGITKDDLEQVTVAGAFGTYLDIASSVTIGMLPAIPLDRYRQVGNAAGAGAKLALLSKKLRAEAQRNCRTIRYLDLAKDNDFKEFFMKSIRLGKDEGHGQ